MIKKLKTLFYPLGSYFILFIFDYLYRYLTRPIKNPVSHLNELAQDTYFNWKLFELFICFLVVGIVISILMYLWIKHIEKQKIQEIRFYSFLHILILTIFFGWSLNLSNEFIKYYYILIRGLCIWYALFLMTLLKTIMKIDIYHRYYSHILPYIITLIIFMRSIFLLNLSFVFFKMSLLKIPILFIAFEILTWLCICILIDILITQKIDKWIFIHGLIINVIVVLFIYFSQSSKYSIYESHIDIGIFDGILLITYLKQVMHKSA